MFKTAQNNQINQKSLKKMKAKSDKNIWVG